MRTYSVCVYHNEKPANLTPYTALASASKVHGPYTRSSRRRPRNWLPRLKTAGSTWRLLRGPNGPSAPLDLVNPLCPRRRPGKAVPKAVETKAERVAVEAPIAS
jgi:hypothetical protein